MGERNGGDVGRGEGCGLEVERMEGGGGGAVGWVEAVKGMGGGGVNGETSWGGERGCVENMEGRSSCTVVEESV